MRPGGTRERERMEVAQLPRGIHVGDRVAAGEGEEHDDGVVITSPDQDGMAMVAWGQGVTSPCPATDLYPLSYDAREQPDTWQYWSRYHDYLANLTEDGALADESELS